MHTAIITGGTKGIGFAIAQAILANGGRVMITGRDQQGVDRAVRTLQQGAGGPERAAGLAVDVRDRPAVDRLVAETATRFGGFNVLVNNAGVAAMQDVAETTDDDWASVIDTNLTGVFYCSRASIPWLRKAGASWIINIASLAARNYFPKGAAYCASKAGLLAFTESLMLEVRMDGIRVTAVMPGSVATGFNGHTVDAEADSWKLTPEDVAEVVVDLLRHPTRSLPSKIEIRPAKTQR